MTIAGFLRLEVRNRHRRNLFFVSLSFLALACPVALSASEWNFNSGRAGDAISAWLVCVFAYITPG